MEALWARSPLSATDVADAVEARGWGLPTVKTLLSRLVSKRAILAEPEGKRFLYSPAIARSDYVGTESRRLVDRLFGGRAAPLFARLAFSKSPGNRILNPAKLMNTTRLRLFVSVKVG